MSLGRATVQIDGAAVTILPRRAPVGHSGPIRGRSLAVFPGRPPANFADRPGGVLPAAVEPKGQPASAILDLSEGEALALGRAAGITQILYWDGRRAQVLDCRGEDLGPHGPDHPP
jgi:hypothetical protein